MYDLFHVQFNLRKNWRFYLLLFAELVLCFSMIVIGLDEQYTYHKREQIYQQEVASQWLSLSNNEMFLSKVSFDHSFLLTEAERVMAGNVYYLDYQTERGTIEQVKLVSVTANFFETYFGFVPELDTGYVMPKLQQELLAPNTKILNDDVEVLNDSIRLGGTDYNWQSLTANQIIPTTIFESGDIVPAQTIFTALKPNATLSAVQSFIKVKQGSLDEQLLHELERVSNGSLWVSNLLTEFNRGSESQAAFVRLFGWVSSIAMCIVFFGTGAMMLLFVERRKEKMRIQYLFGATIGRLRRQLFCELCVVMLIAAILSVIISYILAPLVSSVYYVIHPELMSVLVLIGLCILLSLSITIFVSYQSEWTYMNNSVRKW